MPIKLLPDVIEKFHRSHGIYIDAKDVYLCKIVSRFRGVKVVRSVSGPVGDKTVSDYLQEAFPHAKPAVEGEEEASAYKKKKPGKALTFFSRLRGFSENLPELVEAGVKDTSVFYYAFATSAKPGKVLDIDTIISDNPKAEFLHSSNLMSDWMSLNIAGQNYILMCAAKKTLVEETWKTFDRLGLRLTRVEAGTWAALRAAWHYYPPASAKAPEIRALLGPSMCLLSLNLGKIPLAWQLVHTDPNYLAEGLFPIVQSFIIYTQRQLGMPGVSQIVLQGEGIPSQVQAKMAEMTSAPCKIAESRPYDGHLIAFGLALGALDPGERAMNLSKSIQKPLSLITLFPYLEAVSAAFIVGATLLLLGSQAGSLDKNVRIHKALNAQTIWAEGMSNDEIAASNSALQSEISPLKEIFLGRINWHEVVEEITALVPKDAKIQRLSGSDPLWQDDKKNQKLLNITLVARGSDKRKAETEIEDFLDSLRQSEKIGKYFAKITLSSVMLLKNGSEINATIVLSVK